MYRAALLAVVASVAAAPSVSDACSQRHQPVFELFDAAQDVAYVVVKQIPKPTKRGPGAGKVTLAVQRMVKGDPRARLTALETNTSCAVGFRRGKKALVFLSKEGYPLSHYDGYREELGRWSTVVDAWANAADDAARLAVLLTAIDSADQAVAFDGAYHLANQPELIALLDANATKRLATALQTAPNHTAVPYVLVRLRDVRGVDRLARVQSVTAIEVLAVKDFESVSDPKVLADAIVAGKGERDPKRIAAFERCERVHGRRLFPFTQYVGGVAAHFWPTLADACRTGTPHSYN